MMERILKLDEMAFINDINELRTALRTNICEFVYTKKDGSRRTAYGTTNRDLIIATGGTVPTGDYTPSQDDASTARREALRNAGYISYYDIEKKGWRNCKAYNSEDVDLIASYPNVDEFRNAHPAFTI